MQRSWWVVVVLVCGLSAGAAPAAAQQEPRAVSESLREAQRVLEDERSYRAPGATADVDPAVLRDLPRDTRLLLLPPQSLDDDSDSYETVYAPMSQWARERDLELLLVTGQQVQIIGQGSVVMDQPHELRRLHAHRDVSEPVAFALDVLRDPSVDAPGDVDEATADPAPPVPPDPAEVTALVDALRADPRWEAPGVQADLDDLEDLDGLTVRVAALPVLPVGAPYPDLAPALAQAFPGELVVLVRGAWVDVAGPELTDALAARDAVLGTFYSQLLERDPTPQSVVRLTLERLAEQRGGPAFTRTPVAQLDSGDLLDRLGPATVVLAGLLVGGAPLLLALRRRVRRRRERIRLFRAQRAAVFARLRRLDAEVLGSRPGAGAAAVAERHAVAHQLYEQAASTQDPDVLAAADAALDEAARLVGAGS